MGSEEEIKQVRDVGVVGSSAADLAKAGGRGKEKPDGLTGVQEACFSCWFSTEMILLPACMRRRCIQIRATW